MTWLQTLPVYRAALQRGRKGRSDSNPRRCANHHRCEASHVKFIATAAASLPPRFLQSPWSRHGRIDNHFQNITTRKAPSARVRLRNGGRQRSSTRAGDPGKVDFIAMDIFVAFALPCVAVVASSAFYHPVILLIVIVLVINPYTNSQIVAPLIRFTVESVNMMFLHRNSVDVTSCGSATRQTSSSNSGDPYYKASKQAGFSRDSGRAERESVTDLSFSGKTSLTRLQQRGPAQVFQNRKVAQETSLDSLQTKRSPYINFLVRWVLSVLPFLRYWGGRL